MPSLHFRYLPIALVLLIASAHSLRAQSLYEIQACTNLLNIRTNAAYGQRWDDLVKYSRQYIAQCASIGGAKMQAVALGDVGFGLNRLGKYEDAIPVLRRCTSMYPDAAGCFFSLGDALYYTGKVQEAKEALNSAIQIGGYDEVNAAAIGAAKNLLAFIETHSQKTEPAVAEETTPETRSFGTGFFVTADGEILTNNHVVANCRVLSTRDGHRLAVIGRSDRADLALLKSDEKPTSVAVFRSGASPKKGEEVTAFGYPLHGLLSSGGNVSTGVVSATTGLGDDIRYIQITVPVQPGNSGGPLLDSSGHVIGVVVAKLDALKTAKLTGDIPQNVNFAIHWSEVKGFLEEEGVTYRREPSTRKLITTSIAADAEKMPVLLSCTE